MSHRFVRSMLAFTVPVLVALFTTHVLEAGSPHRRDAEPMTEAEHARWVEALFTEPSDATREPAGVSESTERPTRLPLSSAQGSSAIPGSPRVSDAARTPPDPSWRRIDTFGLRETWGYTDVRHPDSSPIAFAFASVVVPSAYQHCLQNYELVTHVEVRVVPRGGGATQRFRVERQPGQVALALVIPADVWRNAERGRVLAWTSSANPMADAEAYSDQEFAP